MTKNINHFLFTISMASGRGTDVWENGDSYSWNQYPRSTDSYNDLPGPMENRYNNQV